MFNEHQTIANYYESLGNPEFATIVLEPGRSVIGIIAAGFDDALILGIRIGGLTKVKRCTLASVNQQNRSSSVIEVDPEATIAEIRKLANAIDLLLSEPFYAASILNNTLTHIAASTESIDEPPPTVRNLEPCHAETT